MTENLFTEPNFNLQYEQQAERAKIKKLGNVLGFAFCLTVVLNYLLSFSLGFVLAFFSGLGINVESIANDSFFLMIFQALFTLIGFLVPFLIAAKLLRLKISDIGGFNKPKKNTAIPLFLMGVGFSTAANIISNAIANILHALNISDYSVEFDIPRGGFGFVIAVIAVSVLPALCEEFAYRGVFFGAVKEFNLGSGFAIMASSVFFALMHGNLSQIPYALIMGLVLCFIREKSGSVWPVILLHFYCNFSSIILSDLTVGMDANLIFIINVVYIALTLLCLVTGILLLAKTDVSLELKKHKSALPLSKKVSAFYFCPLMIVAYIITFLQILASEWLA